MSTAPTQERETEQILGVVTGLVHKGDDKYQVVVAPDGSQYSKNLWTKDAAVVQYCNSQIGNRMAFLCNASHWVNASNQSVRSLWIEQVGPPQAGTPAMAGPAPQSVAPPQQPTVVQPQVQPMAVTAPPQDDPKQGKIHRQTASKVAAILLGYMPEADRNLASLFVVSERLVAYYDNGLPAAETLDQLMGRAMPRSMDETPPHGDDDIPF